MAKFRRLKPSAEATEGLKTLELRFFSSAEVLTSIHNIRDRSKFYMFSTPVDGKHIDVVLATRVKELCNPKRAVIGMGFLPVSFRTSLMNRLVLSYHKKEVLDDVRIWRNKRYATQPRLSRSDGEIGRYRRYCRQFYPS